MFQLKSGDEIKVRLFDWLVCCLEMTYDFITQKLFLCLNRGQGLVLSSNVIDT